MTAPRAVETPLYTALTRFAGRNALRLNMPGHHGVMPGVLGAVAAIDVTEMPETGDLYEPGGPIGQAQALWADAWDMAHCQFLTGGSTQGIYAAFLAACVPGDAVLIDRCCHRSVFHAMALLDLRPHYLPRGQETALTRAMVEAALTQHPEVKTICITSPTYYGILSEIPRLDGVTVFVDGAHGAHLPFCMAHPYRGADLIATSAHKTLPALGQAAMLFSGGRFSGAQLRRAACIAGTSSPSYPIMASMDLARARMQSPEGRAALAYAAARCAALRAQYPALGGAADPLRLTLRVADGFAVCRALTQYDVICEMADRNHVVFILGIFDTSESFDRLERALAQIPEARIPAPPDGADGPPAPQMALSPRQAMFSPRETVPLRAAAGRVAACQIAPYPPGVPVVAPGERLTKKHLAYLEQIGYNVDRSIEVLRGVTE